MKYLIAGLGNIGAEYELTRHNIGFLTLDHLADKHKAPGFNTHKLAMKTEFKHKGRTFHLIKPTTYMNLSGKAINYWLQELKIPRENLLVIVDDIALPHAKLRMRGKGSDGGHNGLKNIQEVLGDNTYARIRFGVGNDFNKGEQVKYVLENFSKEQLDTLTEPMDLACDMTIGFATIGLERAMNTHNKK